ncbi:MAG TPA: hypothetical protein VKZ53_09700 [Candidatus Angelobacter sp.]|nr:hypothetical protein [Candidatus Angelobacter sp.]
MNSIYALVLLVVFSGLAPRAKVTEPAVPGDKNCQGSACLAIYNVQTGTRCRTTDSIQVDIANESSTLYLRGYVVFDTPTGKVYSPTGELAPGQKMEGVKYVCHGSGTPTALANTSSDRNNLKYPAHN